MQDEPASQAGTAGTVIKLGRLSIPVPNWLKAAWDWVFALPLGVLIAACAAILAGFVSFLLFVGFVIGNHSLFPSTFFGKVDNKLVDIFAGDRPVPKLESTTYNTALINLESTVGIVPTGRRAVGSFLASNGGGMTSFGADIVLLPYTGKLYAASSADTIRETKITGPENNRAQYIAAAEDPANADYNFIKTYLRYNDLVHFETETGQGLLASYTEYHPGELCVTNNIARLDIEPGITRIDEVEAAAEDWTVIYRTSPCLEFKTRHAAMEGHMAGGRMVFEAPSTIYLTSGDFHMDGMRSEGAGIAQNPDAEYGKVMQIDLETGNSKILSMGHRNMQGLTMAPNGNLLVIEHGPRGGDEINWIREGLNYGWPLESYGTTYRGSPIPNAISYGRHTQFEPPIYSWMPSIATSSGTTISGFHEAWEGDLLVGSLSNQSLQRVRLEGDQAVYAEAIQIGSRIRDVHQHTDGQLVVWTDNEELMFFSAKERIDDGIIFERYLERMDFSKRKSERFRTVIDSCNECHSFAADNHLAAPALGRMFGDDIASTTYPAYSDALKAKRGSWTRENLTSYLTNPEAFASGTIMLNPGIEDPELIEAVIDYLEEIDGQF